MACLSSFVYAETNVVTVSPEKASPVVGQANLLAITVAAPLVTGCPGDSKNRLLYTLNVAEMTATLELIKSAVDNKTPLSATINSSCDSSGAAVIMELVKPE